MKTREELATEIVVAALANEKTAMYLADEPVVMAKNIQSLWTAVYKEIKAKGGGAEGSA